MCKKIISLLAVFVITLSLIIGMTPFTSAENLNDDQKNATISTLNSLLIGVPYNLSQTNSKVSEWSDEDICNVIYGKLLCDDYKESNSSYLSKIGLKFNPKEDGNWYFDLSLIQKITKDTLGVDYPKNANFQNIYVSGNELVIMPASGESAHLSVQSFTKQGNQIIAVGTAIQGYSAFGAFQGYFEAVFEENASSVYGYTLMSLESIGGNQEFNKLKASASSELKEPGFNHYAENAIDKNLKTAWVEGVSGIGANEWIMLQTTDNSKMEISAIEFYLGYHKTPELLQKNGWPSKVLIECDNGYRQEVDFYSLEDSTVIILDKPQKTSFVKIIILEAGFGTKYEDTCISEIDFYGIDTSLYFEKYSQSNSSALADDSDKVIENSENDVENVKTQNNSKNPTLLIIGATFVIGIALGAVLIIALKGKNKSH